MGLLRHFGIVARNRLTINTREGLYNLHDGTSFWAMTGGPHEGMLSDLLGRVSTWCGLVVLLTSRVWMKLILGLVGCFILTRPMVVTLLLRFVIGCGVGSLAVLPIYQACMYWAVVLLVPFGVGVRRVQFGEEGKAEDFLINDEVRWSFGGAQGISWDYYIA